MPEKLSAFITVLGVCAAALGGAVSDRVGESSTRIWQEGTYLLLQRSGGHVTLAAPGPYNSYPDFRILSRSGRILAFPVFTKNGWELDWIDLAAKKVTTLERGKEAYWARVSANDRYLSALVGGTYTVFDLKTGRQRVLHSWLQSVIWSREGDRLYYRKPDGAIGAFDARANKLMEPGSALIDREVGIAYRSYVPKSKTAPPADISPSGEFAFMGVLKGGFVATLVSGRYHPDVGTIEPYLYGVTDKRGKVHTFAAPDAYRRQALYPLGWTRSNKLILAVEDRSGTLLAYDPKSSRVVIERLKPPAQGAALIAMGD